MYDFMRWYLPIRSGYHQRSQLLLPKSARDMSRLAHICRIHSNDQTIFTAMNRSLLWRVGDSNVQGAGEDCVVPIVVASVGHS